jgi:hypothetical protein
MMSPKRAASGTISRTGRLSAVCASATANTLAVSEPISHCAATVCIQVPTLEANWAIQDARKVPCRSGAHAPDRALGAASRSGSCRSGTGACRAWLGKR